MNVHAKNGLLKKSMAVVLTAAMMLSAACFPTTAKAADDGLATVTESPKYASNDAVKGMYKDFDHPGFSLRMKLVSVKSEWNYATSNAWVNLEYTFTPKADASYSFFDHDGSSCDGDGLTWTDAAGNTYETGFFAGKLEAKAGTTYTCKDQIAYVNGEATGFHTVSMEIYAFPDGMDVETTAKFQFGLAPAVTELKKAVNLKATEKSIELSDVLSEGTCTVFYKEKKGSKWKEKTLSNGVAKVTGLKSNTEYQVKLQSSVTGKDDEGNSVKLTSPFSKTVTIKTGQKTKPDVKSVSISGAKASKLYVDGYYDSFGSWHNGYYNTTTSFKVTVTLKSAPKNVEGMIFTIGDKDYKVKGSKTTYTFSAGCGKDVVGKSVTVKCMTYNDKGGTGTSPVASVSAKANK